MAETAPQNDDTPNPSTSKTTPDLLVAAHLDDPLGHTIAVTRAEADLITAKGAASRLTEQGLKELRAWIEIIIARRDGA